MGKWCKVYKASKIYGIFVEIKIIDPNNNSNKEQPLINAFDLLMRSSTTLHLPEFNPIRKEILFRKWSIENWYNEFDLKIIEEGGLEKMLLAM